LRGQRRGHPEDGERTAALLMVKTIRYKEDDFGMNHLWRIIVSM